jgi:hypothetical protein
MIKTSLWNLKNGTNDNVVVGKFQCLSIAKLFVTFTELELTTSAILPMECH